MNIQKIIIIGLLISLIVILQYLVLDEWMDSINEEATQNFQNAYDQGLLDAVTAIYQQTENCQGVPINIGNLTKTVFDVSCLDDFNQNP